MVDVHKASRALACNQLQRKSVKNIPERVRSELHTRTPEGLAEKSAAHGLADSMGCHGRRSPSSEPTVLAQVSTDDFPSKKCSDQTAHDVDKIGDVADGNAVVTVAENGNATCLPGEPRTHVDDVSDRMMADAITCSKHGCLVAWPSMCSKSSRPKERTITSVSD